MVERKLRPAPSTLHLLPSRKPVRTGPSHSTKLFVLDTNVLMHDPTSLFRFEEHDIYLPILTLEELDSHKKGMTEVARNARQASRFLDELVTHFAGPGSKRDPQRPCDPLCASGRSPRRARRRARSIHPRVRE